MSNIHNHKGIPSHTVNFGDYQEKHQTGWEEEFDTIFDVSLCHNKEVIVSDYYEFIEVQPIKDFIRNLLAAEELINWLCDNPDY